MRNSLISLLCVMMSLIPLATSAQRNGDEQGFDIPENLQLPQDRAELEKALNGWWSDARKNYDERMSWYNDAKFGCFIHWGVYSVPAGVWKGKELGGYSEHLMRKGTIPLAQYKKELVEPFNPAEFDADEWMRHVKDAGMKYFIITAKHHDGFAMFPSDAYPYDIRLTAYKGADLMKQLRDAAKRNGVKFGFYYSHAFDWEHPDAPGNDWDYDNPGGDKLLGGANWWLGEKKGFLPNAEKYVVEKSIPQIQELIALYDPDILWFDTPSKLPLYLNVRILEAIREADKENKIVVNGRLARFASGNLGDYANTGDRAAYFPVTQGYWESIPTTNESYGYSVVDTVRKTPKHFVQLVASAASKGGNILMNVGPMGNGKWDEKDVEIFRGVGEWLKVNGEGIYGAERSDLPVQQWGVTTWKGDTLYAHVFDWVDDGKLVLGGLRSNIKSGYWVADKNVPVTFSRLNDDDYVIDIPAKALDDKNSLLALVVDKRVPGNNPVRLLDHKRANRLLVFDAERVGSGLGYGDGKVNRNYVKNWTRNDQMMEWNTRLNSPAEYDVYIDYNTSTPDDSGTVILEIGGKEFPVQYTPFVERRGTNSLKAATVSLNPGETKFILKGRSFKGKEYMCPMAVRLEPVVKK
ncbi:MAG: alpha-L-fucosidase [Bacteroides sp.]|nr:alpha-L-fucosidase [Bacteroides sp.]